MKQIIFTVYVTIVAVFANAQDAEWYHNEGLKMAQKGQLGKAITLFDSSIRLKPGEYSGYHDRGFAKLLLKSYSDAIKDFDQAIELCPSCYRTYFYRGSAKHFLKSFQAAIQDYDIVTSSDSSFVLAYYNRGLARKEMGQSIAACEDFKKALEKGLKQAEPEVARCKEQALGPQTDNKPVVLFKEGGQVKLMGTHGQSILIENHHLYAVMFFLFLSDKTDSSSVTVITKLTSDAAAEISILLKNRKKFSFPKSPHTIDNSAEQPTIFMAMLNDEIKEQLKKSPVEKLIFKTTDFSKEYVLTDDFAEAFKSLLK